MAETQSDILARGRTFIQSLMSGSSSAPGNPLPLISACAIAGNGWQENLLRPVTLGAKDHGSDGVMQWRLGRLSELERLPNWNTLQVQAQFFITECQRDYPRLWADLVAGKKSLETLTANVMVQYERPNLAEAGLDHRITYAHALLDHMGTLPKTTPSAQSAAPNVAAASIGGLLVAAAPLLQYLLKDIPPSHILMTVGTGIVLLITSLITNSKPPVTPPAIHEDPKPEPVAVPDTKPTPTPVQSTSSVEQLKALMAQRAAIDAQIAQLQPLVQAMMTEVADLLGKIQLPAQH